MYISLKCVWVFAKKQKIDREASQCEWFYPGSFSGSEELPGMLQDPGKGGLEGSRKGVLAQPARSCGEFVLPLAIWGFWVATRERERRICDPAPRPGGIKRHLQPSPEGKHPRLLLPPLLALLPLRLPERGGRGAAIRSTNSFPPFARVPVRWVLRGLGARGVSLWVPRVCQGGQRGSNRSWKSSKSRIFRSCAFRSLVSLPQPLCLQTVSILCRASKK